MNPKSQSNDSKGRRYFHVSTCAPQGMNDVTLRVDEGKFFSAISVRTHVAAICGCRPEQVVIKSMFEFQCEQDYQDYRAGEEVDPVTVSDDDGTAG